MTGMDFRPVILVSLFIGGVVGIVATLIAEAVIQHVSVVVK